MSNPIKEKITTNLVKAKAEGKVRTEHIREIVRDAVEQTIAELKEGTGEIRLIIKDAISTVIADLKGTGTEHTEKIAASIEGAIAGGTDQRQQVIAQRRARLQEIQVLLDAQQEELDREISEILIDVKSVKLIDSPDTSSEALNLAVNDVQERQESGVLQDQYLGLKSQLFSLDQKLVNRYGDRYNDVKQQWEKAKTWYGQKKAEADESGVIPLQERVTEIEDKVGGFGSVVARKEQEVKQHLQEIWQSRK